MVFEISGLNIIQLTSLIIVTLVGAVLGRVLLFIAPEENKPGKQWFRIVATIMFLGVIFFSIEGLFIRIMAMIFGMITLFIMPYHEFEKKKTRSVFLATMGIITGGLLGMAYLPYFVSLFLFMFYMALSSLVFFPKKNHVDKVRGKVSKKLQYSLDVLLPLSTVFVAIPIWIFL